MPLPLSFPNDIKAIPTTKPQGVLDHLDHSSFYGRPKWSVLLEKDIHDVDLIDLGIFAVNGLGHCRN